MLPFLSDRQRKNILVNFADPAVYQQPALTSTSAPRGSESQSSSFVSESIPGGSAQGGQVFEAGVFEGIGRGAVAELADAGMSPALQLDHGHAPCSSRLYSTTLGDPAQDDSSEGDSGSGEEGNIRDVRLGSHPPNVINAATPSDFPSAFVLFLVVLYSFTAAFVYEQIYEGTTARLYQALASHVVSLLFAFKLLASVVVASTRHLIRLSLAIKASFGVTAAFFRTLVGVAAAFAGHLVRLSLAFKAGVGTLIALPQHAAKRVVCAAYDIAASVLNSWRWIVSLVVRAVDAVASRASVLATFVLGLATPSHRQRAMTSQAVRDSLIFVAGAVLGRAYEHLKSRSAPAIVRAMGDGDGARSEDSLTLMQDDHGSSGAEDDGEEGKPFQLRSVASVVDFTRLLTRSGDNGRRIGSPGPVLVEGATLSPRSSSSASSSLQLADNEGRAGRPEVGRPLNAKPEDDDDLPGLPASPMLGPAVGLEEADLPTQPPFPGAVPISGAGGDTPAGERSELEDFDVAAVLSSPMLPGSFVPVQVPDQGAILASRPSSLSMRDDEGADVDESEEDPMSELLVLIQEMVSIPPPPSPPSTFDYADDDSDIDPLYELAEAVDEAVLLAQSLHMSNTGSYSDVTGPTGSPMSDADVVSRALCPVFNNENGHDAEGSRSSVSGDHNIVVPSEVGERETRTPVENALSLLQPSPCAEPTEGSGTASGGAALSNRESSDGREVPDHTLPKEARSFADTSQVRPQAERERTTQRRAEAARELGTWRREMLRTIERALGERARRAEQTAVRVEDVYETGEEVNWQSEESPRQEADDRVSTWTPVSVEALWTGSSTPNQVQAQAHQQAPAQPSSQSSPEAAWGPADSGGPLAKDADTPSAPVQLCAPDIPASFSTSLPIGPSAASRAPVEVQPNARAQAAAPLPIPPSLVGVWAPAQSSGPIPIVSPRRPRRRRHPNPDHAAAAARKEKKRTRRNLKRQERKRKAREIGWLFGTSGVVVKSEAKGKGKAKDVGVRAVEARLEREDEKGHQVMGGEVQAREDTEDASILEVRQHLLGASSERRLGACCRAVQEHVAASTSFITNPSDEGTPVFEYDVPGYYEGSGFGGDAGCERGYPVSSDWDGRYTALGTPLAASTPVVSNASNGAYLQPGRTDGAPAQNGPGSGCRVQGDRDGVNAGRPLGPLQRASRHHVPSFVPFELTSAPSAPAKRPAPPSSGPRRKRRRHRTLEHAQAAALQENKRTRQRRRRQARNRKYTRRAWGYGTETEMEGGTASEVEHADPAFVDTLPGGEDEDAASMFGTWVAGSESAVSDRSDDEYQASESGSSTPYLADTLVEYDAEDTPPLRADRFLGRAARFARYTGMDEEESVGGNAGLLRADWRSRVMTELWVSEHTWRG
ncbi:hypothetical protein LshimejAT787_0605760 [Lyophyllum shimeji]|uniref:Uncharacterized protein n=1 Tax=Lyophyllum shimeji TaxID=47721 RepID=A0A9P3ULL6_LYOSH|nr:hypothetical protein LshimejAT787_0605760 [Lyophyllum shimeji]